MTEHLQNVVAKLSDKLSISIRDYFEARIKDIEKAVDLARNNMETREFREVMKDQENKFLPRSECSAKHDALNVIFDKISADIRYLREDQARIKGKSFSSNFVAIISVVISALTLLTIFLKFIVK